MVDLPAGPIDIVIVIAYITNLVNQFRIIIVMLFAFDLFQMLVRFIVVDVLKLVSVGIGRHEIARAYHKATKDE